MFQKYLSDVLSSFVRTQYNYSATLTVTVNQTECINISTALFELNLIGVMANYTLHQLLSDINTNIQGIDIGIGEIKICEHNCTAPTVASDSRPSDDNKKEKLKFIYLAIGVSVALLVIIMMFCLLLICKR